MAKFFSDFTAGGVLSCIGDIFGKKQSATPIYTPSPTSTPLQTKKDDTMLFMIGGGALLMVMMFMFMKK